ncbi:hypothetical protein evm_000647 [Chilo suppressalis]|nr:hypothetical protein evm_000647 [Chilo suppressalis]
MGHISVTNSFSQVDILSEFLDAVKKKDCQASILHYFQENQQTISIHKLCSRLIGKLDSPQSFLEILSNQMTTDNINMIFSTTKNQSDTPLWFELRYGRITGSILHEAAHCRTKIGSLLNKIMGEHSKFTSIAMARGKKLEKEVLEVVSKKEKIKIEEAGLLLNAEYPIFGVTPDGLTENYTIEVKCPSTEATILNYVKDNKITPKCWTQVQLQMFFSKRKMALFCIAHPNFEKSKEVDIYNVPYDDSIVSVMNAAKKFWIDAVYPKLKDIYNI